MKPICFEKPLDWTIWRIASGDGLFERASRNGHLFLPPFSSPLISEGEGSEGNPPALAALTLSEGVR